MKIKTISLILIILLIPVFLFADEKDSATAKIKFVLGDIESFGYSSNPVNSMSDNVSPLGEVILMDDTSRLVNIDEVYAYWKINLSSVAKAKLVLTITEDMVNTLEEMLNEEERKMTLPMTVEVIKGETTEKIISGKSSSCVIYNWESGRPEYGSSLLKISCPLGNETNAGEYKGEITLTLEV